MRKTRLDVAHAVAKPLLAMEQNIDAALTEGAALQVAAIEGRRLARLPLEAGQDALALVAAATAKMIAARAEVHQAHRLLRQEQTNMGLGVVSYGDYGDSPEGYEATGLDTTPALTIVQAA